MLATTLHLQLTIAPSARPCANMNKTVTRKNTGPIENQRQLSIGSDLLALEVVGTSLPPPTAVVSYQSLSTAVAKMHATFWVPYTKTSGYATICPCTKHSHCLRLAHAKILCGGAPGLFRLLTHNHRALHSTETISCEKQLTTCPYTHTHTLTKESVKFDPNQLSYQKLTKN